MAQVPPWPSGMPWIASSRKSATNSVGSTRWPMSWTGSREQLDGNLHDASGGLPGRPLCRCAPTHIVPRRPRRSKAWRATAAAARRPCLARERKASGTGKIPLLRVAGVSSVPLHPKSSGAAGPCRDDAKRRFGGHLRLPVRLAESGAQTRETPPRRFSSGCSRDPWLACHPCCTPTSTFSATTASSFRRPSPPMSAAPFAWWTTPCGSRQRGDCRPGELWTLYSDRKQR